MTQLYCHYYLSEIEYLAKDIAVSVSPSHHPPFRLRMAYDSFEECAIASWITNYCTSTKTIFKFLTCTILSFTSNSCLIPAPPHTFQLKQNRIFPNHWFRLWYTEIRGYICKWGQTHRVWLYVLLEFVSNVNDQYKLCTVGFHLPLETKHQCAHSLRRERATVLFSSLVAVSSCR